VLENARSFQRVCTLVHYPRMPSCWVNSLHSFVVLDDIDAWSSLQPQTNHDFFRRLALVVVSEVLGADISFWSVLHKTFCLNSADY